MNVTCFLKILTALPVAAVLALAGCGGGGSTDPSLTFTDAEVIAILTRISLEADSVLDSETLDFSGNSSVRYPASCTVADPCRLEDALNVEALRSLSSSINFIGSYRDVPLFRRTEPYEAPYQDEAIFEFGGWLDHSLFGVTADFHRTTGRMSGEVTGFSVGSATSTNPVSGSAGWRGVMIGRDVSASTTQGNSIQGDADLTMDFSNAELDVAFTNIRDVDDGGRRATLTWNDIPVAGGGFSAGTVGHSVQGQFYGPGHQEVGGTFEGGKVIGAFGATR